MSQFAIAQTQLSGHAWDFTESGGDVAVFGIAL